MVIEYLPGDIVNIIGINKNALVVDGAPNREKVNLITDDQQYLVAAKDQIIAANSISFSEGLFCVKWLPIDRSLSCGDILAVREQPNLYTGFVLLCAYRHTDRFSSLYDFSRKKYINGYLLPGSYKMTKLHIDFNKMASLIGEKYEY